MYPEKRLFLYCSLSILHGLFSTSSADRLRIRNLRQSSAFSWSMLLAALTALTIERAKWCVCDASEIS